tara:strand:+ start:12181 stop:12909 length:729 start_codon:yes stop_codon:yes gene_type:complete
MKKVLVIGESCRDIFVYCETFRLCPDVPVPVLSVKNQVENAGMAKNVQRNIQSFIEDCDLMTNTNWHNITKTRYVHDMSNHMFFRVDSSHKFRRINLKRINFNYDIIVISDYNKGFLLKKDIEHICKNHDNVFLDTKKILGGWATYAKYIKINDYEYNNSIEHMTEELKSKTIRTMGSMGCEFQSVNYPVDKVEVKDTSGAGDSFMAALIVKYSKTNDIIKSVQFANKCASEIVKQRGVGVI